MMEKKKVIFIISRMSIGGSQKSLVNVLCSMDYNLYDVTLYVRENKTDLLSDVPTEVRIVVNEDTHNYYHNIFFLFFAELSSIAKFFKLISFSEKLENCARNIFVYKRQKYERKHYGELNEKYEVAVSYLQGHTCKFTYDTVLAKKYVCFYYNSTNSLFELHKKYLPCFDAVVTVDTKTPEMLKGQYPEIDNKIDTIQNIIVPDLIRKNATEYVFTADNDIVICSCGRLSREKGYDLAVEAAYFLEQSGVNFEWLIVGDGPLKSKIEESIRLRKLEKRVKLLGIRKNPYPIMAAATIFVQPSYEEAQPLSIIEAQILGKPIVATATVGGKSLVKDGYNGIVTEINARALAEGIKELICSVEKYNMLKKTLKRLILQIIIKNASESGKSYWRSENVKAY